MAKEIGPREKEMRAQREKAFNAAKAARRKAASPEKAVKKKCCGET